MQSGAETWHSQMADGLDSPQADDASPAEFLLGVVRAIVSGNAAAGTAAHVNVAFRKDCRDLVRRVALFTYLLEEIRDFGPSDYHQHHFDHASSSSSLASSWSADLGVALHAANRLLSAASAYNSNNSSDGGAAKRISFQFQCVTWKLEKALGKIPYDQFQISDEVQEQVSLLRAQLKKATERYGSLNSRNFSNALFQPQLEEECGSMNHEVSAKLDDGIQMTKILKTSSDVCISDSKGQDNVAAIYGAEEIKRPEALEIPDDFLCPISLELMRDPVIVATGQTYERSYIQRWIDGGNETCPKTQQQLENLTLTPNYVLRSLINQWCVKNGIEQPSGLANGRLKKTHGHSGDVSGDVAAIQALVRKLSSQSLDERKAAVAEIRSLSKGSADNRILIADAGAIPVLVNILAADDVSLQVNAVTCILNLSIFENNKSRIVLAGAIPSIIQVLRAGTMEARENAAAALFSLSLADENKIIIGASGAIPALVDLLQHGSTRGKKDAATALFNLCIYQGNKGRAVRAGIVTALLKMLTDSRITMVDASLTILSILASNHGAKAAIVKANAIPVLIDILRTGSPRNKENAADILLSLCKRDTDNLACISRLGAAMPLKKLSKNGTERAKRKATSLLELLCKLKQL